jgi:DNA polymerase
MQSLLGNEFRVTRQRGQPVASPFPARVMATVRPSSILRARDAGARLEEMRRFVADLRAARLLLARP